MDNPPDDGPCEVTITAPSHQWLQSFVRGLVDTRLAAAVHVDTMHTTYRWAGEVHEADEARARLHTTFGCVDKITQNVNRDHPYEVPCMTATAMISGSEAYLTWVRDSVGPSFSCEGEVPQ